MSSSWLPLPPPYPFTICTSDETAELVLLADGRICWLTRDGEMKELPASEVKKLAAVVIALHLDSTLIYGRASKESKL